MKRQAKTKIDAVKRYIALELLETSRALLLLSINMTERAITWNKNGLTAQERGFVGATLEALHWSQSRHTKMIHRLQASVDKEYGWANADR